MIDMLVSGCWYCCRSYQSGQFSNTSTNIYILGFSLVPNHRMLIYSISIGPLQQVPSQLWRRFLKTCMFTIDSTSALFDLDCWPLSLLWVKSFKPSDEGLTRIGSRLREVSEGGYLSRSEMEVSVHSPPSSAMQLLEGFYDLIQTFLLAHLPLVDLNPSSSYNTWQEWQENLGEQCDVSTILPTRWLLSRFSISTKNYCGGTANMLLKPWRGNSMWL